jgi:hypothetical protein
VLEAHEVGALPGPAPFNPVLTAVTAGLQPAPLEITPVAPHPTPVEAALDRARGPTADAGPLPVAELAARRPGLRAGRGPSQRVLVGGEARLI